MSASELNEIVDSRVRNETEKQNNYILKLKQENESLHHANRELLKEKIEHETITIWGLSVDQINEHIVFARENGFELKDSQ